MKKHYGQKIRDKSSQSNFENNFGSFLVIPANYYCKFIDSSFALIGAMG